VERFLNFTEGESRQIGVDNADRIAPSLDEILYDLSLQSICFLS
jgi:D-3-phosphoglycerate dehydrogenase